MLRVPHSSHTTVVWNFTRTATRHPPGPPLSGPPITVEGTTCRGLSRGNEGRIGDPGRSFPAPARHVQPIRAEGEGFALELVALPESKPQKGSVLGVVRHPRSRRRSVSSTTELEGNPMPTSAGVEFQGELLAGPVEAPRVRDPDPNFENAPGSTPQALSRSQVHPSRFTSSDPEVDTIGCSRTYVLTGACAARLDWGQTEGSIGTRCHRE